MVIKTEFSSRLLAGACLATLLFSGCMPRQSADLIQNTPDKIAASAEIKGVPFFPQQDFQCGPASLAMALGHAGVEISPEQLRPDLFIPDKRGTLQIEMMAVPRRYGLLAYPLKPQLSTILQEINAGHPVIVFQNLGLSIAPQWHYAVVTGFDLTKQQMTLHSGNMADYHMSLPTFERTWVRAGSWARIVLPAGALPVDAEAKTYLHAVAGLEQSGLKEASLKSYQAALNRWPENLTAWMGRGNSHYSLGNLDAAAMAFTKASRHHPGATAPLNNLAQVRLEQGRYDEALSAIKRAVGLDSQSDTLQQTYTEIQKEAVKNKPVTGSIKKQQGE